jgi:hypothetical protein
MADTTISQLNTINALSANNFIPISDGTNTTKLGTDSLFGFRNRIINGGMNIWQRGTVINNPTTANFYTADRWGVNRNGDYAADLSVGRVAATGLPGFQYCMALQRNVGSPSTQAIGLWNSNESANTYDLAGGPITLSFWLKVGANYSGGAITIALYTGTGIDQRIYQYTNQANILNTTISPNTTWARYSFTANVGSAATELGSYFTWTPTGVAGGDDSVYITGVQLEEGSTATPFERRPMGTELALCQRYFEKSYNQTKSGFVFGINDGESSGMSCPTALFRFGVRFAVTKRAVPTISTYDSSGNGGSGSNARYSYYSNIWYNGGIFDTFTPRASDAGFYVGTGGGGIVEGQFGWTANAEL